MVDVLFTGRRNGQVDNSSLWNWFRDFCSKLLINVAVLSKLD